MLVLHACVGMLHSQVCVCVCECMHVALVCTLYFAGEQVVFRDVSCIPACWGVSVGIGTVYVWVLCMCVYDWNIYDVLQCALYLYCASVQICGCV